MVRHLSALALAMFMGGGGAVQAAPVQVNGAIIRATVKEIASDAYEGRGPATPAETKTINYIAAQFAQHGLKPGVNGQWFQEVPTITMTADPAMQLHVEGKGQSLNFAYGTDVVLWTKRQQPKAEFRGADLVYVGYGVRAPAWGWDDYAGLDVRGKTVVVEINDPGYATGDPALFNGKAMTYYGRWTYKYEEAARQGAAAVLIVHETGAAAYPWGVVRSSNTGPKRDIDRANKGYDRAQVEGWITGESATKIFAAAGLDYAKLKAQAAQRGFKAVPLGLAASVKFANSMTSAQSHNVIGIVPGSKYPGEYILYTAHWDHLGHCTRIGSDDICNGAVDNASGIGGLMAIADAFQRAKKRPERSVLFIAWTLEESGLLGSSWYASQPVFPLAQTVAGINMDSLQLFGPARDMSITGAGKSELENIFARYVKKAGRVISAEIKPEAGHYFRSDHFPLAKAGVPMLAAEGGLDIIGKPEGYGRAASDDYVTNRYHKPTDEYSDSMDFDAAARDLDLFYQTGVELANTRVWPNWYKSAEFRAARDASRP